MAKKSYKNIPVSLSFFDQIKKFKDDNELNSYETSLKRMLRRKR